MTCVLGSHPGSARRDSATADTARHHGAAKFPVTTTNRGGQSAAGGVAGPFGCSWAGKSRERSAGTFFTLRRSACSLSFRAGHVGATFQISSQSATRTQARRGGAPFPCAFSRIGRDIFLQPAGVRRSGSRRLWRARGVPSSVLASLGPAAAGTYSTKGTCL
jgi:hypothetical protein